MATSRPPPTFTVAVEKPAASAIAMNLPHSAGDSTLSMVAAYKEGSIFSVTNDTGVTVRSGGTAPASSRSNMARARRSASGPSLDLPPTIMRTPCERTVVPSAKCPGPDAAAPICV